MTTTVEKLEIGFSKAELRAFLVTHLEALHPAYEVKDVCFYVSGHEDPDDWRAANALSYDLDGVAVTMVRRAARPSVGTDAGS